jgi:hypothetical protein
MRGRFKGPTTALAMLNEDTPVHCPLHIRTLPTTGGSSTDRDGSSGGGCNGRGGGGDSEAAIARDEERTECRVLHNHNPAEGPNTSYINDSAADDGWDPTLTAGEVVVVYGAADEDGFFTEEHLAPTGRRQGRCGNIPANVVQTMTVAVASAGGDDSHCTDHGILLKTPAMTDAALTTGAGTATATSAATVPRLMVAEVGSVKAMVPSVDERELASGAGSSAVFHGAAFVSTTATTTTTGATATASVTAAIASTTTIICGAEDTVYVIDANSRQVLQTLLISGGADVSCLALCKRHLIAGCDNGVLSCWERTADGDGEPSVAWEHRPPQPRGASWLVAHLFNSSLSPT